MALTSTTLSAACAADAKQISVTSATGYPGVGVSAASQLILVDGEFMYTVDGICQKTSAVIQVRSRGALGSLAVAHDLLAPTVTSSDAQDFPPISQGEYSPRPPGADRLVSVGQDGAIAVPTENTTIILTKATALGTTTLGAPSQASDGIRVTITTQTAAAHVITATALLGDGAAGSPEDTATFAAYIGASMVLVAVNGVWNIVSLQGVTIS